MRKGSVGGEEYSYSYEVGWGGVGKGMGLGIIGGKDYVRSRDKIR